jgi:LuxR family maltose regulon positive regulatory protein
VIDARVEPEKDKKYAPSVTTSPGRRLSPRSESTTSWAGHAGSFALLESKFHVPMSRPGIVDRDSIVDRLVTSTARVIAVVAPPGYGKTTLLSQLAERKGSRVGWISADDADNDPVVLLSHVVEAVDRIEPVDLIGFRALSAPGSRIESARRVGWAINAMQRPITLIIDHFESVTSWESCDAVAALALELSGGSQLAIGSRNGLRLGTARLRAQGELIEIGIDDLAMETRDATVLLTRSGVDLAEADVQELVGRTEGWPAGLYLAALALTAGGTRVEGVNFTGDDRFMGDYLRSELLDRVSSDEVSFLTRTAILDRMCGPLCDAVLETTASSVVLEQLERRNLLVVALDRRREWYRYHTLFRELLLSELQRREPASMGELHRRAALWYEANGEPEIAIGHAQAARDDDRVADLVLQIANPVWASGRADSLMGWMEWFESNKLLEQYPAIAVHGALMFALTGRPAATERWTAAAERAELSGTLADGNTMEATLAYLRALLCRDGVAEMRRDAELAAIGLDAASPYRATMLHVTGLSYLLEGDAERADAEFARAVDSASHSGSLPVVPVLLAERGVAAVDREDWDAADAFAEQMLAMMKGGLFDDYWTSALVFAFAARMLLRRGDLVQGQQFVVRAAQLRPLLSYGLPVVSVQALLEMARAYIALGDQGGARAVLRQARDIFQQRPKLGALPELAERERVRVDKIGQRALGASSLTTAELRLLPLLPTHLSFREIADRLYVSRHTVKTQAISIYRKLGVSSRSEAIERVREQGLLEHA